MTNIPAPYRLPVYTLLAQEPDIDLHVVYCSGREPDRHWNLDVARFPHTFLNESFVRFRGRFIHINHDVWSMLVRLRPHVVVTTGFNPTHLMAYVFARLHGARHVAMTDGTLESEAGLSSFHRALRRHVYRHSFAFIGASEGALRLFQSYSVDPGLTFKSHLCADNELFSRAPDPERRYDLMFCGRFERVKNPFFALDVAQNLARTLGRRVSILFVGSGGLEAAIRADAARRQNEIDAEFAGFARQEDLPRWYKAARIFLFPSEWDPWGVVANEACASGMPVVISPAAGAAGELIRHEDNGYVLPLKVERWADACARLLVDNALYRRMAERSRVLVAEYTYRNASAGIAEAVRAADREWHPWSRYKSLAHPKVVIIQRRMTAYRVPLFNLMRQKLRELGVELIVVYGDPLPEERLKSDTGALPWGVHVPCCYWFGGRLCWQNAMPVASNASLVVVTQENRLLFNYARAILKKDRKWALWGHGRNFQSLSRRSMRERFKRWLAKHVDWWFAYTKVSRDVVVDSGFPEQRITILNNAIDTAELAATLATIQYDEIARARHRWGIAEGPVGLSLASLHADKRLDFLLEAARRVRARIPDFQLVLVGDGPLRGAVSEAATKSGGWIHWIGAQRGRDKATALALAKLMLNPGMVGLSVLDSLVSGVPMVTTEYGHHSPEIAYLEPGRNGWVTADTVEAYAEGVVRLLQDEATLSELKKNCVESSREYTLERMAANFCDGILQCLGAGERESRKSSPGSKAAIAEHV